MKMERIVGLTQVFLNRRDWTASVGRKADTGWDKWLHSWSLCVAAAEPPWNSLHSIWGSVKIPCWPACLESLGHRSGWGPHRFTWFGYMVLISVLICKGIPLSWSRSDLVSAWHLGGLRCPWPPSSNASPQRWSSTAQKKKLTAHTPASPPAPFFWKGRATVVWFSFYISSFHIYSRVNLAQWLVWTANNRKVPGSSPACGTFAFLFTRGVTS